MFMLAETNSWVSDINTVIAAAVAYIYVVP